MIVNEQNTTPELFSERSPELLSYTELLFRQIERINIISSSMPYREKRYASAVRQLKYLLSPLSDDEFIEDLNEIYHNRLEVQRHNRRSEAQLKYRWWEETYEACIRLMHRNGLLMNREVILDE